MGEPVDGPHAESPFPLTDTDKWVLSQTDQEFKKHDWQDLKHIIETNQLCVLKRSPSDLRRYMSWTAETNAQYGSTTQYLLANRLPSSWGQPPFTSESDIPFDKTSDYRVLLNDWPYGLERNITHLVVWTRTRIPIQDEEGDMTAESRALVGGFVRRYFADALDGYGGQRVLWFRNWGALQSVRALEHIHVLVRDVDDEMLERWTGERPGRGR
ncbi:hypothetical protein E4U55_002238 [Claviceps digitariae]|nr:hypothetical protein E4U55_002238 [Claviceps digitariae]